MNARSLDGRPVGRGVWSTAPVWVLLLGVQTATAATIPPGLNPGDIYHRIFVTSGAYSVTSSDVVPTDSSSFGGVAAADYNVTLAAYQAGLIPDWDGETIFYRAILSTSTIDARDHVDVQGAVFNMQDELIATSETDLWDGTLANAVRYDEVGISLQEDSRAWTGSTSAGTYGGAWTAGDWLVTGTGAWVGKPLATNGSWLNQNLMGGSEPSHLYGISLPLTVVPEPSSGALAGLGTAILAVAICRRAIRVRRPGAIT
ncbi:MAG: PEP-CTERM sorting domain-containing protein [Pirellulales bacterium]